MKTVILGAGPGGIAAAIQLTRMGGECLVFEKNRIGGLINNAWRVENSVFLKEPATGKEIAHLLDIQLRKWSIPVLKEEVLEASYLKHHKAFRLETGTGFFESQFLVDATGTVPIKLPMVSHLPDSIRKFCFYEVSELREIRNCRVAVIGAGDAAFDYALNMCSDNTVDIYNRSSRVRSLKLLVELAHLNRNISYNENVGILKVESGEQSNLKLTFQGNKGKISMDYEYLIVAIGREPSGFSVEDGDYAIEDGRLYTVGDKRAGIYRQMTIAAGQGVETGMKIYDKIASFDNTQNTLIN